MVYKGDFNLITSNIGIYYPTRINIMATISPRKFFLCTGQAIIAEELEKHPDSHIIGELCYRPDEGKRVTALARWDVSVNTKDPLPEDPSIDVYLIGDARDIKCRCAGCTNKARWEIGKAALDLLLGRAHRFRESTKSDV
jgi:hypothetical protein